MNNLLDRRRFDGRLANGVLSIVGRVALCYLFVTSAVFHLTFGRKLTIDEMTARGLPFPAILNVFAMMVSAGLALALLFNIKTRWAALGLAGYTLCVSWVMYGPFQSDWRNTVIFFMKDQAIFGALLAWSCALAGQAGHSGIDGLSIK